jgi:hypothetical protein
LVKGGPPGGGQATISAPEHKISRAIPKTEPLRFMVFLLPSSVQKAW